MLYQCPLRYTPVFYGSDKFYRNLFRNLFRPVFSIYIWLGSPLFIWYLLTFPRNQYTVGVTAPVRGGHGAVVGHPRRASWWRTWSIRGGIRMVRPASEEPDPGTWGQPSPWGLKPESSSPDGDFSWPPGLGRGLCAGIWGSQELESRQRPKYQSCGFQPEVGWLSSRLSFRTDEMPQRWAQELNPPTAVVWWV